MARYYPLQAQVAEQTGNATLMCGVRVDGSVGGCTVESEAPANWGFGAAAIGLSPLFKMKPRTKGGQPVDGAKVRIPIAFRLAEAPETTTSYKCYAAFVGTTDPAEMKLGYALTLSLARQVASIGGTPADAEQLIVRAQHDGLGAHAATVRTDCRTKLLGRP